MANKNIRGITIEIGGDTSKLGKALESSEKKSRALQVELREIQHALKFDPTNVDLLNQKQTVLTQNISETSNKLEILKEAERQVIAQFERGEVAEEQVRALRREILQTENQLASMDSELEETTQLLNDLANGVHDVAENTDEYKKKLAEANEAVEDFKGKASEMFDTLKTGALALGASAVAVGGYAVNLADEFDQAYHKIQIQTGATAEEMETLETSIDNIYKSNLGESLEDIAVSMATVKTQTNLTGQELEDATSTALLMRDAFGFEVDESIRGVSALMEQFGLTAIEAYDLIAQGAQKGLNSNGDLMDVINEYSVHFSQLGFDSMEMFNILKAGADSGAFSVDKVGDAFKEFGIRVKDESDATKTAFEQLGLNADKLTKDFATGGDKGAKAFIEVNEALAKLEDPLLQNQVGVALFGSMWEDLGAKAVTALVDYGDEFNTTGETLDMVNEKSGSLSDSFGSLKKTLETDVVKPLGEELKPVIEDVVEYVQENAPAIKEVLGKIIDAVGGFIKLIIDNKDAILTAIVAIGGGLLAWNVYSIISSVVTVITTLFTAIKAGIPIMQALNLVMNANPIGIIITLIGALVGAFIYLWNTSDEFRAFFEGLWESLKEIVGVAIDAIVAFFSTCWEVIKGIISGFVEFFTVVFEVIKEVVSTVIDVIIGIFEGLFNFVKSIITGIRDFFVTIFTAIKNFISGVIEAIKGFFTGLWEGIKSGVSGAWDFITGIFGKVANWFYTTLIEPVKNFFTGMWDGIKNGAKNAWEGIKSVFSKVADFFGNIFSTAWNKVKSIFSVGGKIFDGIKDGIVNAFKAVVNAIIKGINKVVALPFDGINWALKKIKSIEIFGLKPFDWINTIGVPQIPLLYRGGVLKKGQVGLLEGNGAEAVVPLEKETGWINRIAQKMNELQDVKSAHSNEALASKMDEMIHTMKATKSTIVLDTGVLVGETITQIDEQLSNSYTLRERRV